jgi:hypothetical protein
MKTAPQKPSVYDVIVITDKETIDFPNCVTVPRVEGEFLILDVLYDSERWIPTRRVIDVSVHKSQRIN